MSSVAVPWDSWPGGDKVIWDQIKPPVPKANAMEPDTEDECIFPSCGVTKRKPTQELFLELFYSPYPNNITFQKHIVFSFLFTFFSSPSHLFAVN